MPRDHDISPASSVSEAPIGSFGPVDRFIDQHGLPKGRKKMPQESLAHKYKLIKELTNNGALNEGIWEVEKLEGQRAGKRCVLKKIKFDRKAGRLLLREIEVLHALKHPNVVGFIEACIPRGSEGIAELYLEYCDRGSLQDLLNTYVGYNKDYKHDTWRDRPWAYIPEGFIWHVFRSLASALAYLHDGVRHDDLDDPPRRKKTWPYILHRDIKPDNILLKSKPSNSDTLPQRSNYPTVVLADFGVCTQENEVIYNEVLDDPITRIGTFLWQPPETPMHSMKGEVWTIGVIMLSLCRQYPDGPIDKKKTEMVEERYGLRDIVIMSTEYSKSLAGVIRSTYYWEPENRPTARALLGDIRETEAKLRRRESLRDEELPDWV